MKLVFAFLFSLVFVACGTQIDSESDLNAENKQFFNDNGELCKWPYFGCWQLKQEVVGSQQRYEGFPVWAADSQSIAGVELKYLTKKDFLNAPLQSIDQTKDMTYRLFTQSKLGSEKVFLASDFRSGIVEKIYYMIENNYVLVLEQVITADYSEGENRIAYRQDRNGVRTQIISKKGQSNLDFFDVIPSSTGKYIAAIDCLADESLLSEEVQIIPMNCSLKVFDLENTLILVKKFSMEDDAQWIELNKKENAGIVRSQIVSWQNDDELVISNGKSSHFKLSVAEESLVVISKPTCFGPSTSSSLNSDKGERLGIEKGEAKIVSNLTTGTETYLCK